MEDADGGRAGSTLVVINPHASRVHRRRDRERVLDMVRGAVIERTGRAPIVHVGDTAEATVREVERAADGAAALVIAVGGDGTVRDVAAVLSGRAAPLGIVPAGTANLFAATAGVPRSIEAATRALPAAAPRPVDLGLARWGTESGDESPWRVFVVAAGIGFDARVMAVTSRESKRRFGRYAYFVSGVRMLRHVRGSATRIEADDGITELRAIQVLVANAGELIPGVLRPAHRIDPRDGRLDVIVVEGRGPLDGALGGLEAIARRGMDRSRSGRSRRLRVRTVRVTGEATDPVEVDGDVVGAGWLEACIVPHGIRVLVPRRAESPSTAAGE